MVRDLALLRTDAFAVEIGVEEPENVLFAQRENGAKHNSRRNALLNIDVLSGRIGDDGMRRSEALVKFMDWHRRATAVLHVQEFAVLKKCDHYH